MIWHTATVPPTGMSTLLAAISGSGGVITSCRPLADGVHVTWTTTAVTRGAWAA
jgi:hypothetical protein